MRSDISDEELIRRVDRVTPRQRDCLRSVLEGYESKEIARLLSISVSRVDKHIKEAMARMGVSRRIEAARLLAAFESRFHPAATETQRGGAPPLGLARTDAPPPSSIPEQRQDEPARAEDGRGTDDRLVTVPMPTLLSGILVPRRAGGRLHDDLTILGLTKAVMVIASIGAVAASAALSLLLLFDRVAFELLRIIG